MTFYQDLLQERERLKNILHDCQETLSSYQHFSSFTGKVNSSYLLHIARKVRRQTRKELELTELLIQVEDDADGRLARKPSHQRRYWTRSSVTGTRDYPIVLQ